MRDMSRGWWVALGLVGVLVVVYAIAMIVARGWLGVAILVGTGIVVWRWVRYIERRDRIAALWREADRGPSA